VKGCKQPTVIAADEQGVDGMVATSAGVFWGVRAKAEVHVCRDKGGCATNAVVTVATGVRFPEALRADAKYVYAIDQGGNPNEGRLLRIVQ
jgi:hypothetical protein